MNSVSDSWMTPQNLLLPFHVRTTHSNKLTECFLNCISDTSRPKESGEIDGSDYHFISRTTFESEVNIGKFLEHGEYDKQYYGTSLDRYEFLTLLVRGF